MKLIQSALEEQQVIAWTNMFWGYLSLKWYQLASSHSCMDDDGANWVHWALNIMYEIKTALWILGRNQALHGCAYPGANWLTALDIETTKYHSEAHLVLTDNRFYRDNSLAQLLRGSSNERRWLIWVKASRTRKAPLHQQQPRITKFFPPQQDTKNKTTKTMPATNSTTSHCTKITQ